MLEILLLVGIREETPLQKYVEAVAILSPKYDFEDGGEVYLVFECLDIRGVDKLV